MKQIIIVLFISMPIYLYGQVEETEPNDYGESGIITLDFDINNTGASYIPPCVGEDCDPELPFERDVWYVPVGISGERTITYSGTNTAWFEMYTSDSNYTPNSGVKVVESLVNDTTLVFEFIDSSFYFIEITGSPDSSNIYSFSVSSELPKPYISADSPLYIGSTNEEPDSSAILELESTTKGFLPPRMTDEEILAIENPAEGLMVYSTTEHVPLYFDNVWKDFGGNPRIFQQGDFRFGGIILSVNHFGEVIVLDTSFLYSPDTVAWGCDGVDIPLIEDLYNGPYNLGATNSQIISDSCGTTATAADIAFNHVVESDGVVYNDWHLPTLVSGNYLIPQYANSSSIEYWLAHQEDANNAVITDEYSQTFSEPKTSEKRLILIRTFKYSQ